MAQSFPWRSKEASKNKKLRLPRAVVIPDTRAYELLVDLLDDSLHARRVLRQVQSNGLMVELRDGSSLAARKDGSLVLLEVL